MGKLLDFIKKGLSCMDSGLGDRSKYVGSSDIGQCMKKSYLSKTQGEEHDLKQLLVFARGHITETIVKNGLLNNPDAIKIKLREQVELGFIEEAPYVKTHLDFVVDFPHESLAIECKSISSPLPNNEPRESWIQQVQVQMAALQRAEGKTVRGKIIAINLNTGDAFEFDIKPNKALLNAALQRANELWEALQKKREPKGEMSDLCAYCPFKGQCDTLRGKKPIEFPDEVAAKIKRFLEIRSLRKEEYQLQADIKGFMEATGIYKGVVEDHTVYISKRNGRETIDLMFLKNKYPEIAKEATKKGSEYIVLKVA